MLIHRRAKPSWATALHIALLAPRLSRLVHAVPDGMMRSSQVSDAVRRLSWPAAQALGTGSNADSGETLRDTPNLENRR